MQLKSRYGLPSRHRDSSSKVPLANSLSCLASPWSRPYTMSQPDCWCTRCSGRLMGMRPSSSRCSAGRTPNSFVTASPD